MYLRIVTTKVLVGVLSVFGMTMLSADTQEKKEITKKEPTKEELFSPAFKEKLSVTYGHLIQKSLDNPTFKMDANGVVKGIQEAASGKAAPMTDKEYEEAIQLIQKYSFEDMAAKNLEEAESYMKNNAKEDGIVQLEEGKLQYKIMEEGDGEEVTEETVPTINYSATYSNGNKLGSTEQQGGPIDVPLDQTIPGFKKGLMGMKVGEKRRIFVHPTLGYGASGPLPNGLLIFDIEVVGIKAKEVADADDEEVDEDDDSDDDFDDDDENDEDEDEDEEDSEDDEDDDL